ncbi:MAG TPA: methyltransferase domain-containing protein, partial [Holophagaceae bacterium]
LRAALGPAGARPRLFVPERPAPIVDGPEPLDLAPLLNPEEVEFHPCAAPAGPSEALFGIAVFHALGDVLNLTPVARQLKADHPGCRIVWFTSEACAPLLAGNPYIDELVALPGAPKALDAELPRLQASRPWTRFLAPAPYLNYDKSPGGSLWDLYRAAPGLRWTEGLEPVLVLDPEEVRRAEAWWSSLPPGPRILVEWEFTSEQSRFDEAAAFEMAARLADLDPLFIFSGRRLPDHFDRFAARHRAIGCTEPFRLNAVFYNRCDAFIGVSSGLTALSGSTACRSDVPSVEYVRGEHWSSAGLGKHTERMYAFTPRRFSEALDRLRIRLLDLRWAPDTTPRCPPLERLADGRERVACPACGDTTARPSREGEIVECAACALVYRRLRSSPPPEAARPRSAGQEGTARRPDLVDQLLALGTVPPDGLLVDVQCGRGDLLLEARDRGLRTLGFESNAAAADVARDSFGLEVRSESFVDTSLAEGSAHAVVFHHSLERASEPAAVLDRAAYLLEAGGLLVVATPNFQGLGSEALRDRWEGLGTPETVTFFTPQTLRTCVLQAGFDILSCTTQAGPGEDAKLRSLLQKLEPGATEARCQDLRKALEAAGRGEEIRLIARKRGSYQGRALPAELRIAPNSVHRILWVRTDALGDALLSASMLGPLAERFPGARIAVVCQAKAAPIYEACPHVADVFVYDRLRALQDP